MNRHAHGPVKDVTPSRNIFYLFSELYPVLFSLVFVYFSWEEEFQAATNLLSKLLLEDEEINGNGDFAHGKSNSVLQNLNQSSSCTQAVSNESNLLSFSGEYISLASESQGQVEFSSSNDMQTSSKGGTLTMKKSFVWTSG